MPGRRCKRRTPAVLALGGAWDVLRFWDLSVEQVVWVPWGSVVFGPHRVLGKSYAMVLTLETPPSAAHDEAAR